MEQHLEKKIKEMTDQMDASKDTTVRKQLRSDRKEPKQALKNVRDFIERKQKYARDLAIMQQRNSYSKTDHDATFMRMKDDYMKNGQLKAGYNIQLATEGQYALAYDVFPNPTDVRTLAPFLSTIEEKFFSLPTYLVGDAGYGSEENYKTIRSAYDSIPLVTYSMFRNEKSRAFKKNAYHVQNWPYDEKTDQFTCPTNKQVTFQYVSKRKDKAGFERSFRVYECESCQECPVRSYCTKAAEGRNRQVRINTEWESHKQMIRDLLSNEKASSVYAKRKVDVEPVFGFLKANLRFTRFSVRGTEKVKNEIGFAFMAVNLRKYQASSGYFGPYDKKRRIDSRIDSPFYMFRRLLSQPLNRDFFSGPLVGVRVIPTYPFVFCRFGG
ncbi:hypothetical protein C6I21_09205 [Alkalicoccus urumqiensis]|uniref:Transposase DDE domain-containing protein n=2 Tax=Alkalicoccus urumqiensis TaxID=1548213 RepID=A0A2P6MHE5_ALKUR|nr:hypothetical protein C6I21_09205 [Alkalicoccus urumqiensis]